MRPDEAQAPRQNWLSRAFNLPLLQKSRMQWVDYLKGIAIILVVYRHVLIGIQRGGVYVPAGLVNANMIFYSFRMPLFFILSGIFIGGSLAKRNFRQLAWLKFENLLWPYFVWAFIQISLQILLVRFTNSDRGLKDYLYILYQPRNLDQFWYLPALFNTTIIYVLVKTRLKPPPLLQLTLGLFLYFISSHLHTVSMITDWMEFYFFFALGDSISTLFFHANTQRFLQSWWTLLVAIPLFVGAQLFYLRQPEYYYKDEWLGQAEFLVIALIGCFAMLLIAFRLQISHALAFLRVLGYHSLYIYVMHVIVAAFTRMILVKVLAIHNPVLLLIGGIFSGVTVPIIFYNLVIKDNVGWFLMTLKKPARLDRPRGRDLVAAEKDILPLNKP
jgi:fucose 4-O-acetylase-like acetyltransferase